MTGALLPAGYETLEDANGVTVPGGLIWTYAAGTTTPLGTYTDNTLGVLNANPIIADGAGRWSAWATPGTGYKLVFETPATPPTHGATIKTCDNLVAPLTDATAGATGGVTVISDNTTGTVNNFVLAGRTKETLWVWNGSADLILTGISGGAQGDRLTIKNMSTTASRMVWLRHMSASSTNAFYNISISNTASTPVGPSGWATYVSVGGTWVLTDHQQGQLALRPFVAGNFGASGSTFTVTAGQVTRDHIALSGKILQYVFDVSGTVGAASSTLTAVVPYGFAAAGSSDLALIFVSINGAIEAAYVYGSATAMFVNRLSGAAFPAAATVRFTGTLFFEIT